MTKNTPVTIFILGTLLGGSAFVPAQAQETPATPLPASDTKPPPAPLPASATIDPLIGPIRKNDVISVQVAGEASLSGIQRVTSEGTIVLPLAGQMRIESLMPGDAANLITETYKKKDLLKNPQVIVTIVSRPQPTAFISGALQKQGRIPLGDNMHLDEVLEPAGVLPTSDLSKVVITRGAQKIIVDYQAYRTGNDTSEGSNNPVLQDGDKVYIRARLQVAGTIKVNGEVRSPQPTPFISGLTVAQAIQQAGGVTELADREQVIVSRGGKEITVSYKAIQEGQTDKDIPLQDLDEIFVRRLEKPKTFSVNGGVVRSSIFPLVGTVTLSDAIANAGGFMDRADKKKVVIQRKNDKGEVVTENYDMTVAANLSAKVQPEDVISVPYPPQPKQRPNIFSMIGSAASFLFLFRR